ncbi:PadR family transcriptional regulator [Kitasatospora sp. NBC_01287]|uniref:PadR family transcriptional regulator n=1 Tax=Kitasatospora sp. NBC_01287 TaxID=2903573 RepID=UPI00224E2F94|nr:PadR family transcriptional regulator [Kitasatospora sp. NBC_01287]MCX4749090.1 PadR family transcriptional regulator [Kitasatospora sp. NBC_01287]
MLTLAILGFLAERPMHAYELRRHISELIGHNRPVSDGALYPAINRLSQAGHLEKQAEPGDGAPARQVLRLTGSGRAELVRRLAEPKQSEITSGAEFFTLLAFLSHLPGADRQAELLRRRLEFLTQPASFFSGDSGPVRISEAADRYRRGMLVMARATRRAEVAWLEETLGELRAEGEAEGEADA